MGFAEWWLRLLAAGRLPEVAPKDRKVPVQDKMRRGAQNKGR